MWKVVNQGQDLGEQSSEYEPVGLQAYSITARDLKMAGKLRIRLSVLCLTVYNLKVNGICERLRHVDEPSNSCSYAAILSCLMGYTLTSVTKEKN